MKRQPPQERDVKQPSGEKLSQALDFVGRQLTALESVPREPPFNEQYRMWHNVTAAGLKEYFGRDSDEFRWVHPRRAPAVVTSEAQREAVERRQYAELLSDKGVGLQSILHKCEVLAPTPTRETTTAKRPARAFISHGGQKPSLTLIQDFLRALGVEPVVVEQRASEGRELHENVDRYRQQSDFAVILLTKDVPETGRAWHPSGSVGVEVGELKTQFGSRVIYLKEKGVKLPAMVSTLVHETFTEKNMARAYMKIVTELHGWGWLTVSPPEGDDD
jgi:predicted nucleotide-binding protein